MTVQTYEAPVDDSAVDYHAKPVGALALTADQTGWTSAQEAALAQLGIAEAPQGDQQVFMHVAQRSGLDPFARQIYLIGRYDKDAPGNKKWTIQTGIDGFRVMAERRPEYAGQTPPQWCDSDGKWTEVWLNRSASPSAARVGVYRTDRDHVTWAICHFWEFAGTTRDGSLTKMWREKGAHQIAKCAEAGALRKAFPQDFSGLYITEEMDAAGNPDGKRYPVRARAQRVSSADLTGDAEVPEPRTGKAAAETAPACPEPMTREQRNEALGHVKAAFDEAGVSDRDAALRVMASLADADISTPTELSDEALTGLIDSLRDLGADGIGALATGDDKPSSYVPDPSADPWAGEQPTLDGEES